MCTMIARLCLGRCGTLIEKKGAENYCKACKPAEKPANKRYNNAEWRKISKAARKAQPWCTWCQTSKDLTVDHIVAGSIAGGIMVLCRSCNSSKGNRDARNAYKQPNHPSRGLGPED